MARPLKPLIRSGGFYPSRKWTPLVYAGGYTTANGGEEPAPPPIEKTVTGNPIHILDALAKPAQALSVKLEPIQDLHGYDYPWPAGGGKNKLPLTIETAKQINRGGTWSGNDYSFRGITYSVSTNSAGNVTAIKATGTATAAATFILTPDGSHDDFLGMVFSGCPSGGSNSSYLISGYNVTDNASIGVNDVGSGATIPTNLSGKSFRLYTAVMSGYSCPSGGLMFYPMIRASSESSTYAPYSNICPISGHTDADVVRTGKNLLDMDEMVNAGGQHIGTLNADGSLTVTASGVISVQQLLTGKLKAGKYTITNLSENRSAYIQIGSGSDYAHIANAGGGTRTFDYDGASYLRVLFTNQSANSTEIYKAQLELGSTATAYEPYQGQTYTIDLDGTRYGGTLDVLTGLLTVDRAMVDLGSLNWAKSNTSGGNWWFSTNKSDAKRPASNHDYANVLCSQYEKRTPNQLWGGNVGVGINYSSSYIVAVDSNYSDATAFKTAMDGVQLVYALAEPVIIPLTLDTPIELLEGENNIWSDGTMTLVYLADGNASDEEALNILLGGRYVNNHGEDEPTDREALDILLGR